MDSQLGIDIQHAAGFRRHHAAIGGRLGNLSLKEQEAHRLTHRPNSIDHEILRRRHRGYVPDASGDRFDRGSSIGIGQGDGSPHRLTRSTGENHRYQPNCKGCGDKNDDGGPRTTPARHPI